MLLVAVFAGMDPALGGDLGPNRIELVANLVPKLTNQRIAVAIRRNRFQAEVELRLVEVGNFRVHGNAHRASIESTLPEERAPAVFLFAFIEVEPGESRHLARQVHLVDGTSGRSRISGARAGFRGSG